ncbi:unnamed protein product [Sphenostylis stenocarpa]|uniref:Large ribosomal subunit protein eL20 domain-containing protein n=1 Tax=Sphenostylis stenocarpa TaxID=92480 RepID=A0AA86TD83_9FABA|nr:unnamed protein product [Sphenostylis stenocarpa]
MSERGKDEGIVIENPYYGTFQGVTNYYPLQCNHPPSFSAALPRTYYQQQGHHVVPGIHSRYSESDVFYAIAEGRPLRERRLPCCGLGYGWLLFIIGWVLGGAPWYVGTFVLVFVQMDSREKPGLIACAIASFITMVAVISLGVTQGDLPLKHTVKVTTTVVKLCNFQCDVCVLQFHQYQVVGRALPTEADQHPKIYRMKLWATNEVRAKSKFWYFLRKLKKVKKSNGQMLAINEIFEKNPTKIKNYGIWLRYQSRTGYHNMYKEYRDTTLNGAVEQMYNEMASRHRVRCPCIQIIKTATIPAKLCKRESTKQFHNSKIKFPLVFKKVRPPSRKLKTTYKAKKPNLFM